MASITEIKYETPSHPRQIRLDTTTNCNARCLSCHRFLSERQGKMDIGLIREILSDVSRWLEPLTEIIPVNYGEFFFGADWRSILEMISQKLPNTQIVIPTNGTMLDEQRTKSLCEIHSVKIINFSVNAFFDETYRNFTGRNPEDIKLIAKAVERIKVLRPDIKINVSMVFDPIYQTDLERDLFINYWRALGAEAWILPAASAGRPSKQVQYPVKIPCRSIFSDIVVGYDGKISSCCFDAGFKLDLGYYNGNLLDNWRGKELTKLRELHNDHKRETIDLCSRCTFA